MFRKAVSNSCRVAEKFSRNGHRLMPSSRIIQIQRYTAGIPKPITALSACQSLHTDGRIQKYGTRAAAKEEMFCFQCEQTKSRKGCTVIGVCGKTPDVAALQDLLVHVLKGLSTYAYCCREYGIDLSADVYDFTFAALFSTLTNVNFDANRFVEYIKEAVEMRDTLKSQYESACVAKNDRYTEFFEGPATWEPGVHGYSVDALVQEGKQYGVKSDEPEYGDDINGVRQMIIYGLKGLATYAKHARHLGQWDDAIGDFAFKTLAFLAYGPKQDTHQLSENLALALEVGAKNLKGMELLNNGHRQTFGVPSPTKVRMTPIPGKAILVSGHDMTDLHKILKATEGSGINVYTHGEMLPAHGYPGLREFKHLVGHFGGPWQLQKFDFTDFPGLVVMTTNCLVEPWKSYKNRLVTLNECGWDGVTHLKLPDDAHKLVEMAEKTEDFTEKQLSREITPLDSGYGHEVVLSQADKILGALKKGELKRVFVIGGCDGAEQKRNYFNTLAKSLPKESVILTMGCAKFRINKEDYGTLGTTGIPRLLDLGQCNDSYGAVVIAQALSEATNTAINDLPISISLSWFEQKAVAVLLSLLHLGVKNIRLGPVLPAFITPTVLDILVEKFDIKPIDVRHPKEDLELMMDQK